MKYFYAFLVLISVFSAVKAQKNSNVRYFKNNGKIVDNIDSADFIRVIKLPDTLGVNFELLEYYTNKNPKRVGHTSASDRIVLEGLVREFYPNNILKEISFYKKNKKIGASEIYHENGKLHEKRLYKADTSSNFKSYNYVVKQVADTLGNTFLDAEGNGRFKVAFIKSGNVEEGNYKKGLRDGNWKTFIKKDSVFLDEVYQSGKFIAGIRAEKNGEVVKYTQKEILPVYKGGISRFYDFLGQRLIYPKEAKDKNIQGRVVVGFVVEKDGSLTDIRILRDIGSGCGEEAVRVVTMSPKWNPGEQNGRPVRVSYSLPVVFSLKRQPLP